MPIRLFRKIFFSFFFLTFELNLSYPKTLCDEMELIVNGTRIDGKQLAIKYTLINPSQMRIFIFGENHFFQPIEISEEIIEYDISSCNFIRMENLVISREKKFSEYKIILIEPNGIFSNSAIFSSPKKRNLNGILKVRVRLTLTTNLPSVSEEFVQEFGNEPPGCTIEAMGSVK